jgi:hypothetical protein
VPIVLSPAFCRIGYLASSATLAGLVVHAAVFAKPPISSDHAFALTLPMMLLAAPLTWEHSLLILLPAVAITGRDLPIGLVFRACYVGTMILLYTDPASIVHSVWFSRDGATPFDSIIYFSCKTYGMIAVFIIAYISARRVALATSSG